MGFWEDFGEGLIRFGNNAGSRVKESTDAAFSGVEKKARRQELDAVFTKLGKAYFDREEYGAMSYDMEELMLQARDLDRQIREIDGRLCEVKGNKMCVSCKSSIKVGSAFCPVCGAKQVAPINDTATEKEEQTVPKPSVEEKNSSTTDDDIFED